MFIFNIIVSFRVTRTEKKKIFLYKDATVPSQTVLIRVKAFNPCRKEMDILDDTKIVDLYLQRNEAAIKETFNRYGNRLRSLAYGIVEDLQTAEECENDTYMEA